MTAKVLVLKEFDLKGIRMKFGERRYGKGLFRFISFCGAGSRFSYLYLRFSFLSLHRDPSIDKADKIALARRQLREKSRYNRYS